MTSNEERALSALLTSKTKLEAAEKAGITDRTMRRYFENPEFCQRYREAFAGVVQDATRRAQQLLEPALSTLQTVMEDEEIPAQARITAAKSIIDYSLKLTEQADILEQLRELERWKEELNGNR
ncbi:MAG: hypothetical protein ACLRI6_12380 [Oscillospiraceae bacterium]